MTIVRPIRLQSVFYVDRHAFPSSLRRRQILKIVTNFTSTRRRCFFGQTPHSDKWRSFARSDFSRCSTLADTRPLLFVVVDVIVVVVHNYMIPHCNIQMSSLYRNLHTVVSFSYTFTVRFVVLVPIIKIKKVMSRRSQYMNKKADFKFFYLIRLFIQS